MIRLKLILLSGLALLLLFQNCGRTNVDGSISFYSVPLECGAAPEIGCGSRIKPLFIDLEKESPVSEVWTNREGTVLAIKWKDKIDGAVRTDLTERLFKKHKIMADYISEGKIKDSLNGSLTGNEGRWLKGMAVDSLSHYEAGVIAHTLTDFALEAKMISEDEQDKIRGDLETYFKKELVMVRTEEELTSETTQGRWHEEGFMIYEKYIGKERAEAVSSYFNENENGIMKKESCCSEEEDENCCKKKKNEISTVSTITCPNCGNKKKETLPTDVCTIKYTCENCKTVLHPKEGDCCVFCTYGDHKCPSKQENN